MADYDYCIVPSLNCYAFRLHLQSSVTAHCRTFVVVGYFFFAESNEFGLKMVLYQFLFLSFIKLFTLYILIFLYCFC